MNVLVLGGTGTVGSQVARELVHRGADVSVLTRDAKKPVPQGARVVTGDLLDPETIRTAFRDRDAVFLITALSAGECHEGLMAVNGCRLGGVKKVVFLSVHRVDEAPHLPHFGAKLPIEAAVQASGIPWTILRPNNFYQNDYWWKDAILQYGVYPQPLGSAGVSRVDTGDIADAAVRALTENGHAGKTYTLAGPDPLTGTDCAAEFAKALGKPVAYAGDDLEAWAKSMEPYLPKWAVYDYRLMYAMFQAKGLRATPAQLDETRAILGREPRKFSDYVRDAVAAWKS
jgi:uncharacterized protein YbjT (DUF2867 family)